MKRLILIATLFVALLSAGAPAEELYESVRFAPGTSGIELERGIARGDTLVMHLEAAKGQYMTIDVTSLEDNVTFYIICEEGQLGESYSAEGSQYWEGTLPVSGVYFIHLGTTRGGGEFTIEIGIE
jgi:hypothetical protein